MRSTEIRPDLPRSCHDVGINLIDARDRGVQSIGLAGTRRARGRAPGRTASQCCVRILERFRFETELGHVQPQVLPCFDGGDALREKNRAPLLDKERPAAGHDQARFRTGIAKKFERNIVKPYGMVLVTGPTGSGKTNTLYSSVARLNQVDTNIMTAEDPVEFQLSASTRCSMKEADRAELRRGVARFLCGKTRTVILVGEIRDFETAEIGVKAALTGHMVLSTLHTNDAPSTISRLMTWVLSHSLWRLRST